MAGMDNKANRKRKPRDRASMVGLGIVLGAGIGAALGDFGVGIGIGIVLGAAMDMHAGRKHDSGHDSD